jgi:chromosomal replication initiation ATPase DnaA
MLINQLSLEQLLQQIKSDPDRAAQSVRAIIHRMSHKLDNTFHHMVVIQAVTKFYNLPFTFLNNSSKENKYKYADQRMMLTVMLANCTRLTTKEIMDLMGYKHNSSVSDAVKNISDRISIYKATEAEYKTILEAIYATKEEVSHE